MIRFTDLITGDFESEADREVAPFIMFLGLPVIAPCMIGYWGFKGAQALYYHNPIRYYSDRKRSIKMIENGEKPGIYYAPSHRSESSVDIDSYLDMIFTKEDGKICTYNLYLD